MLKKSPNVRRRVTPSRVVKMARMVFNGLIQNTSYFLSGFFPRNKNMWLFGAWEGLRYCDNAKYLFEHILNNKQNEPKQVFWLTYSETAYDFMKNKGYPVILSRSWKAWWYNLRAGYLFVTHGKHDVIKFLSRGAVVINLNHSLPIKHMGFDVKNISYFNPPTIIHKLLYKIISPYWNIRFDYVLSASRQTSHITRSSLRAREDQMLPFGFPRFVHLQHANPRLILEDKHKHQILYIPTFREGVEFNHFGYGFDRQEMEKSLDRLNATLLIALHPFDSSPTPEALTKGTSPNIHCIKPMDINELLPEIDVLITDFSSVMFDYLLLDRPMIYTQFDFEEFLTGQRGLYFDYADVTAGHKAKNWPEVLDALFDILKTKRDPYSQERERVRKKMFNDNYENVNDEIIDYVRHLSEHKQPAKGAL
jgi:CDP-glycerol glycerophosphotransferase (TagB/SpsB family)